MDWRSCLVIYLVIYANSNRLHLRNPQFPDNEDLWRYKCFVSFSQSNRQSTGTEVVASQQAVVEEDGFDKMLCLDSTLLGWTRDKWVKLWFVHLMWQSVKMLAWTMPPNVLSKCQHRWTKGWCHWWYYDYAGAWQPRGAKAEEGKEGENIETEVGAGVNTPSSFQLHVYCLLVLGVTDYSVQFLSHLLIGRQTMLPTGTWRSPLSCPPS